MGAFVCPGCLHPQGLAIKASLQLPADARSDEIAVQVVACEACGFRGVAVYEESRRGALDSDSWEHTGYRVDALDVERLASLIAACPRPDDRRCSCPSHAALGATNEAGCVCGWEAYARGDPFPLRLGR